MLFLLYTDDLHSVVQHSSIKLFADDVAVYNEIKCVEDCEKLQEDLHRIFQWTVKWQLQLNLHECDALITRKHKPIQPTYYVNCFPITWKSLVCYLRVHINSTLDWSDYYPITATKSHQVSELSASFTLGLLFCYKVYCL